VTLTMLPSKLCL